MNWLDKIQILKREFDLSGRTNLSLDVDFFENCWQQDELEELVREYPYLPSEYIDFIKEFDGCGLAWVTFYGSKNSPIIPLREEIDYWFDKLKGDYFPFGKDASGSIYLFDRKGRVLLFDKYDYEFENPKIIAENFVEFVDKCLLGKRYEEFNYIEKDGFYNFLKSQGWV
jgi:SMI1 / KNR4 family (SUKH-1)